MIATTPQPRTAAPVQDAQAFAGLLPNGSRLIGIDVGTKADIQKLVLDLAAEGRSCVFISSELDEVLRTSHRIVVLRDRGKAAEVTGEVDEKDLMTAIAGVAT